jgi:hypothetical protein
LQVGTCRLIIAKSEFMYLKVRIKNPSLIDFRIADPEERDAYPINMGQPVGQESKGFQHKYLLI